MIDSSTSDERRLLPISMNGVNQAARKVNSKRSRRDIRISHSINGVGKYLYESDVLGELSEALPRDVQSVFANETMSISSYTTVA